MADPTTTTIAALAATVSGASLALFGVDYYSLLYGFVGALLALMQAESMGRNRAMLHVSLSTFVGAAFGNAALITVGSTSRSVLILGCLIGGAGATVLVAALIRMTVTRIDKIGGEK